MKFSLVKIVFQVPKFFFDQINDLGHCLSLVLLQNNHNRADESVSFWRSTGRKVPIHNNNEKKSKNNFETILLT